MLLPFFIFQQNGTKLYHIFFCSINAYLFCICTNKTKHKILTNNYSETSHFQQPVTRFLQEFYSPAHMHISSFLYQTQSINWGSNYQIHSSYPNYYGLMVNLYWTRQVVRLFVNQGVITYVGQVICFLHLRLPKM